MKIAGELIFGAAFAYSCLGPSKRSIVRNSARCVALGAIILLMASGCAHRRVELDASAIVNNLGTEQVPCYRFLPDRTVVREMLTVDVGSTFEFCVSIAETPEAEPVFFACYRQIGTRKTTLDGGAVVEETVYEPAIRWQAE